MNQLSENRCKMGVLLHGEEFKPGDVLFDLKKGRAEPCSIAPREPRPLNMWIRPISNEVVSDESGLVFLAGLGNGACAVKDRSTGENYLLIF